MHRSWIWNALNTCAAEGRHAYRQEHAVPALDRLKAWLHELQPTVLSNSGAARALAFRLKGWEALARSAEYGRYPIDNNLSENAIRPIALGRKNWLFAGSEQAGKRAAAIMSLLVTAKANSLEPHAWLSIRSRQQDRFNFGDLLVAWNQLRWRFPQPVNEDLKRLSAGNSATSRRVGTYLPDRIVGLSRP